LTAMNTWFSFNQERMGFGIGDLFNFGDYFHAVDDAADGYEMGVLAPWQVNQKGIFKFCSVFQKLVIGWIGFLFIKR